MGGATVTFEPGARTAWHNHPLGQTLIVTAGSGWVQRWDGPIEEIRPGDVVLIAPGEKHWHGATTTTAMTHISIVEQLDGKSAGWMEKVSDDLYVRSVNGRTSAWFRGARVRNEGHIRAGGVGKDVAFVDESDPEVNDRSTPPTAKSTAATLQASLIASVLRHDPRRSSLCRAQRIRSVSAKIAS